MSERTVMQVVSDIRRHVQTVELAILVDELVLLVAKVQADADRLRNEDIIREGRAAYMRDYRKLRVKLRNITPPSLSPPMINNSTPPISPQNISIKPTENPLFAQFWEVYPRKVGKGEARKAWRNALKRATAEEIIAGAKRYAASKPDPEFTKHPGPWLNADRWLDESSKVIEFGMPGPKKTYREMMAEKEKSQ